MKKIKTDETRKMVQEPEVGLKKSKIRLYWEERERLGAKGEIINMRAVLR